MNTDINCFSYGNPVLHFDHSELAAQQRFLNLDVGNKNKLIGVFGNTPVYLPESSSGGAQEGIHHLPDADFLRAVQDRYQVLPTRSFGILSDEWRALWMR